MGNWLEYCEKCGMHETPCPLCGIAQCDCTVEDYEPCAPCDACEECFADA